MKTPRGTEVQATDPAKTAGFWVGQRVRVGRRLDLDRRDWGKAGVLLGYTPKSRWAVLKLADGAELLIHPESLEVGA